MTDDQYLEAKKLIDGNMSIRKAAEQVCVPYATLRRRLQKGESPQAAPESESVPESYRFAMIRRHENQTRKQQGLSPLTDEQWAVDKAKLEECERQMNQIWQNSNDQQSLRPISSAD